MVVTLKILVTVFVVEVVNVDVLLPFSFMHNIELFNLLVKLKAAAAAVLNIDAFVPEFLRAIAGWVDENPMGAPTAFLSARIAFTCDFVDKLGFLYRGRSLNSPNGTDETIAVDMFIFAC